MRCSTPKKGDRRRRARVDAAVAALAFAGSFAVRNARWLRRSPRSNDPRTQTGGQMLPAYGLYGHIRNNNIKSTVLLASFALYIALLWFVFCLLWIGITTKYEPIIMRLDNLHPPTQSWQLLLARTVDL